MAVLAALADTIPLDGPPLFELKDTRAPDSDTYSDFGVGTACVALAGVPV